MPQDEALEGGFLRIVAAGNEPFQKLRVGEPGRSPRALKSVSRNRPSVPNRPLIAEILPTISVRHSL